MSEFKIDIYSPDGEFSEDEIKELVEDGFRYQQIHDGTVCRLSPITVEKIGKKSAFQEWNTTTPSKHRNAAVSEDRKEGWNAALDTILNLPPMSKEQIEKLREP